MTTTYTIELISMSDASLTPQRRVINFEKGERPTIVLGNVLRKLLKWTPSYKSPVITLSQGDDMIGMVKASGKGASQFTNVNMELLKLISESRFTTEELTELKSSSDGLLNDLNKPFGHKGTKLSPTASEERLKAVHKSFKDSIAWAKADGKSLYESMTPTSVKQWKIKNGEERKQLAAAKKLLK
jgi:hypothetical protein